MFQNLRNGVADPTKERMKSYRGFERRRLVEVITDARYRSESAIDRPNHGRDGDFPPGTRQTKSSVGSTLRNDDSAESEFSQQLLEVGGRNRVSLADLRSLAPAPVLVSGDDEQCKTGVFAGYG